jgi:general secretion pathway protein G
MRTINTFKKVMTLSLPKGFTLIELLVVIAIIAIITSIGVANLITAQKQARDAARREIMGNTQSAFEQYYAANTSYPVGTTEINSAFDDGVAPSDPKDSTEFTITWNTAIDEYCVCAKLESGNGNADTAGVSTQCNWNNGGEYYCIQNKQ